MGICLSGEETARGFPGSEGRQFNKVKKLPPTCPYCKEQLVEVFENEYNTYVFDSASGTYRKHEWKGEIEMFCPYCNAKLYDVFPDGVCNYVSKIEMCNERKLLETDKSSP